MVGWTEVIIVVAILVLLFGASKIPELARGVGEGINEFRKASEKGLTRENNENNTQSDSGDQQQENKETKQQKSN